MNGNGVAAFGALAQQLARGLDPTLPLVLFDHAGAAEGLKECARRRFSGLDFYVRPLFQKESSVRMDAIAATIVANFKSTDERSNAFAQASVGALLVNGAPISTIPAYDGGLVRLARAAVRLAHGTAVSSSAEHERLRQLLDVDPVHTIAGFRDALVPSPHSSDGTRDSVVIWAPLLGGDAASSFALALCDIQLPLILVAATAPSDRSLASWMAPGDAANALKRARLIVDTNAFGSDSARALAEWSVPIVADLQSGASEILTPLRCYDRTQWSSLHEAAVCALGYPPPQLRVNATTSISLASCGPAVTKSEPLVSIIIPTFDRPVLLRYALESIRHQHYKNVEVIIVVDGGPALSDLEASFPEYRFVYMPENDAVTSCNHAYELTKGKYVTFLNDDDLFFPDHVSSLVNALEQNSGGVAHGDVLTAFLRGSDEAWELYGFENNMSRPVSHTALLASNQIGMTSCMFRRDAIADGIPFDRVVPLYRDYALWLRLAEQYTFIHVERLTSCYTIRNSGESQQSNMLYEKALGSYEVLYERYPTDRPALQARRAEVMQSVKGEKMQLKPLPAGQVSPTLWPLWPREA